MCNATSVSLTKIRGDAESSPKNGLIKLPAVHCTPVNNHHYAVAASINRLRKFHHAHWAAPGSCVMPFTSLS